jgi:hypothetical protein
MSDNPIFPVDMFRDIESELSEPLFRGMPIGRTLNDVRQIGVPAKIVGCRLNSPASDQDQGGR